MAEAYGDMAILTIVPELCEYTIVVLFIDHWVWHSNLPHQSDTPEKLMWDMVYGKRKLYAM
jgi:hypothetical protein